MKLMDRLRKIRNSAIFIDMLLVVVAIVAIIGLATFVHLRGVQASVRTEKQTIQQNNSVHAEPLTIEATTPTTDESPASSAASSASEVAANTPTASTTNTINGVAAATCDEAKKLLLLSQYGENVAKENSLYQNKLSLLGSPLSFTSTALQKATSLLQAHETTLTSLKKAVNAQLQLLKCPTL